MLKLDPGPESRPRGPLASRLQAYCVQPHCRFELLAHAVEPDHLRLLPLWHSTGYDHSSSLRVFVLRRVRSPDLEYAHNVAEGETLMVRVVRPRSLYRSELVVVFTWSYTDGGQKSRKKAPSALR